MKSLLRTLWARHSDTALVVIFLAAVTFAFVATGGFQRGILGGIEHLIGLLLSGLLIGVLLYIGVGGLWGMILGAGALAKATGDLLNQPQLSTLQDDTADDIQPLSCSGVSKGECCCFSEQGLWREVFEGRYDCMVAASGPDSGCIVIQDTQSGELIEHHGFTFKGRPRSTKVAWRIQRWKAIAIEAICDHEGNSRWGAPQG